MEDCRGITVTSSSREAVERFDATVSALLGHLAATPKLLAATLESDPGLVPALVLKGCALRTLGRNALIPEIEQQIARARWSIRTRRGSERETVLVDALDAWVHGDPGRAATLFAGLSAACPQDLLALKLEHACRFMMGDSHGMRYSLEHALSGLKPDTPGFGFVLGCYAFSLVETGALAEAERAGRRGLEHEPGDAWGAHAVAHVMEMQDRTREGIAFLKEHEEAYADCNNFAGHVYWHRALFHVAEREYDEALRLYDERIFVYPHGNYRETSNASSLLFQLEVEGVSVGDRWQRLAASCRRYAMDHGSAFADVHYMLTLASAERAKRDPSASPSASSSSMAMAMLDSLEHHCAGTSAHGDHELRVQRGVGLPICRGIYKLYASQPADALKQLEWTATEAKRLGGSAAQRDLLAQLQIVAAIRAQDVLSARRLLDARLMVRPKNAWAWRRLSELPPVTRKSRLSIEPGAPMASAPAE